MGLFKLKLIDNQGIKWWILPGSNQRPKVYETSALTTELRIHEMKKSRCGFFSTEIIYSFLSKNQAGRETDSVFEDRIMQEETKTIPFR